MYGLQGFESKIFNCGGFFHFQLCQRGNFTKLLPCQLCFTFQMTNQTIKPKHIWNTFYLLSLKYDNLGAEVRILIGTIHVVIAIISGILNSYVIYLLITREKLRNVCNLMLCVLIWNNVLLLFGVMPIGLLELYIVDLQKNQDYVSLRQYLYLNYVFLCFYSAVGIAIYRLNKIQKNSLRRTTSIWTPLIFIMTGIVVSSTVPFIDAAVLLKHGPKAVFISATAKVSTVTVLVVLSYIIILNIAKQSQKKLAKMGNHKTENQSQQMWTKLRRNINLVLVSSVFLIFPALVQMPLSAYNLWKPKFFDKNMTVLLAVDVVSLMFTLLTGITHPAVYFYTQTDIQKEIQSLEIKQKCLKFVGNIELQLRSLLVHTREESVP